MRFAYADPPYIGMAHLYKDHPDYGGEVDHKALIARLMVDFPDGWALSAWQSSMQTIFQFCPASTRVLAWCQPDRAPYDKVPAISWEPVFLFGGRRSIASNPVRDFFVTPWSVGSNDTRSDRRGHKPEQFCFWLFRCLGALPGDELVDLFPGSGAVSRAWDKYQRQMPLPTTREKIPQLALDSPS